MLTDDEEFIAYRPDEYTHIDGDPPKVDDEDELAYEKALPKFKWNEFMNEYNSLAASHAKFAFKRVKRDDEDAQAPPPAEASPPEGGDGGGGGGGSGGGGGDGGGGSSGGGGGSEDSGESKLYITPIIGLTVFFAVLFIVGPFLVRKGPNRGIVQCSIMLSAFCMWIFWVTVYIGQMNPLMGPRLDNTTLAWMSVKLGNPVKPAAAAGGGE